MRAEIARVSPLKNEPLDANVPKNAGVVVDAYELQAQVVLSLENSSLSSRHSENLERTPHWATLSTKLRNHYQSVHPATEDNILPCLTESKWNFVLSFMTGIKT